MRNPKETQGDSSGRKEDDYEKPRVEVLRLKNNEFSAATEGTISP